MKIIELKTNDLIPYDKNAKKHDKTQIDNVALSIRKYGFKQPVVVDSKNVIVIGHCRVLAAKQLKLETVPCVMADDLTPDQIKELRIIDNKTNESDWDIELLTSELADIDLSEFDLDFGGEEPEAEAVEDDFDVEANIPDEPIAQLGDIWQLGEHRIMCGDSTDGGSVALLMNGAVANLVVTDPPYNVQFNGRSGKFDVIKNDDLSQNDFEIFINKTCDMIKSIAKEYYVWCNWKFYSLLQANLEFTACIVWAKNVFGLGNGYRHQHEFCLTNAKIDAEIKNESDLWEVAKDTNYQHPTQKPIELFYRILKNHKATVNIVDLFGGSGSTLIACEQLNRKCFMMELDPKYVDVIIARWEKFTGKKAVKC